ncbi:MAG: FHA domain-containing protein [Myxococcota bacterium]
MSASDLVLTPVRGETDPRDPLPLERNRIVTVGRTGNMRVLDPLVSFHHAQLYYDEDERAFVVKDLDSATGTIVDGECVKNEIRVVKPGTDLRIGETTFRIERARGGRLAVPLLATLAIPVVAVAGCTGLVSVWLALPRTEEALVLNPPEVVLTPAGSEEQVEVPREFLRERGLRPDLQIRDQTDHDNDGTHELWIDDPDSDTTVVVTFDASGGWVDLGSMPLGCVRASGEDSLNAFPTLNCRGELWQFLPEPRRYVAIEQDNVVVWYRKSTARPKPPPPAKAAKSLTGKPAPAPVPVAPKFTPVQAAAVDLQVGRFAMEDTREKFRNFLVDRGIQDKVHYLICEQAFEGIRAQVLTERGEILPLYTGCLGEPRLEGIAGEPYAIALTPVGRRALVDDVTAFYAGDAAGLFLPGDRAGLIAQVKKDPGDLKSSVKLVIDSGIWAVPLDPSNRKLPWELPPGTRSLEAVDRTLVAAPKAETRVLARVGPVEFDTELRCPDNDNTIKFRANVGQFARTSLFGGDLVQVDEVGCSGTPVPVLTAGYEAGPYRGKADGLDVLVDVEHASMLDATVIRVRLSWRPTKP